MEESELLDGELTGYVLTIGGYTVRIALCLYRDDDEVHYTRQVSPGRDIVAHYRQGGWRTSGNDVREVQVVSAGYNGAGSGQWQHICIAATSIRWEEDIDFIVAWKPMASAPVEQEVLAMVRDQLMACHKAIMAVAVGQ